MRGHSRSAGPGRAAWLCLSLLLGACATPDGAQQFAAYQAAFDQMHAASDAILDELAVAERMLAVAVAADASEGARPLKVDEQFDPAQAVYYASAVEPPLTRAYRTALEVVDAYNEALVGLASGRSLAELKGQALRLGGELGQVAEIISGTAITAAVPGLAAALPLLDRLVDEALAAASRAAFQAAFLENFGTVDRLLVEMRNGTADLFPILTRPHLEKFRKARLDGAPVDEAAFVARHEAYRTSLSNWVVLIDETRRAMAQLKAALEAPPDAAITAADLTRRAEQLRRIAEAVRAYLARSRVGAPL